jgi:hypothetical protein
MQINHPSKERLKEIANLYPEYGFALGEADHIAECVECIQEVVKIIVHNRKLRENGNII